MRASLVSSVVVVAVCGAAAAGWAGTGAPAAGGLPGGAGPLTGAVAPAGAADAVPEASRGAVRNRAAWQPSPVPAAGVAARGSQREMERTALLATGLSPAAVAAVAALPAAPGAPAPQAAIEPIAPVTAGAAAGVGARAGAGTTGVIPMDQQLIHDRLEAMFGGGLPAERGEWREVRFHSRALGREEAYLAWLPPGYGTAAGRSYPALYLLHGAGGPGGFGVQEWLGYALTEDLDRLLALGLIEPMVVVLPDGGQGYWMNHAGGGPRWGDYVAQDLVRHVDATFRTDARRERRAVGGLSMGGHGALQLALNYLDVFGVAGAHSPTLRAFADSPEFFGDARWFAKHDPLSLVHSTPAATRIATWIDVGADDSWRPTVEALAAAYRARRAPLEYRVLEGEHEGWYWRTYLPEYLKFYSGALAGERRAGK